MMRTIRFIMLALSILAYGQVIGQPTNEAYYYADGEKVTLTRSANKAVVRFAEATSQAALRSLVQSVAGKATDYELQTIDKSTYVVGNGDLSAVRRSIRKLSGVRSIQPVYLTADGFEMIVTDEIVAELNEDATVSQFNDFANQYGIEITTADQGAFKLRAPQLGDALELSNKLYESGLVKYAHPDFIAEVVRHQYFPNDPYFNRQFGLHNVGQVFTDGHSGKRDADVDAPEAWDISLGSSSIVVAVIDEGVTSNHPDLPNSRQVRLNGSNFASPYDGSNNPNNPSPTGNGNHGNACAGVIAATQNNNQGVTGIAPRVKIMPVKIPFGFIPSSVYANAINFAWQNGADILSNSWGYGSSSNIPVITSAIQNAATSGRGGKGAVVVFAAGNTANHASGSSGIITFPGNVAVSGVVTVGASDRYDKQANYSPTSNPASSANQFVDLTAPSHRAYPSQIAGETFEVWTIDIPGNTGYNPWAGPTTPPAIGEVLPSSGTNFNAYTARFGGTSAATPLVSGIAALALSVSPNLTKDDVFDILRCTADKVGGYVYTTGVSNELGAGRANAFDALVEAYPLSGVNISLFLNVTAGQRRTHKVSNQLTSASKIQAGGRATNIAGSLIRLNPGFHAKAGSQYRAFIAGPCTGTAAAATFNTAIATSDIPDRAGVSSDVPEILEDKHSAYPNPFVDKINVSYTVHEEASVSLMVFDIYGNKVIEGINNETKSRGVYQQELDGTQLAKGAYIYVLQIGDQKKTGKIMKIR